MKTSRWLMPLAILITTACAHVASSHVIFVDYAGDPVASFRYTKLYNWQRVDDHSLAVWTKPSEAFLLDIADHCQPLESQYSVQFGGVASVGGYVRKGDDVIFGPRNCRILAIRPLDLKRMKKR